MLYQVYQAFDDLAAPMRAMAGMAAWGLTRRAGSAEAYLNGLAATYELIARTRLTHKRPPFGLRSTRVGSQIVEVHEESVDSAPFGTLLHFRKAVPVPQPRVLLVAPLSGHFATLLRDTVQTLLPEHDVFITDWHNARDVNLLYGPFGFDDFIAHIVRFIEAIGPGAHVAAVCQPGPAVLAAVAAMAESRSAATPRSLTLIAAPMDTRIQPTSVNQLANSHSIEWFERHLINTVPLRYPGALRRVYPGFLQVSAFLSMNMRRHVDAHQDLVSCRAAGRHTRAEEIATFYDEYFAVMDLAAEFYLDTVRLVFQEHALPRGRLEWRGRRIDPGALEDTALLTVEGERDDICSVGQTYAAHDLCRNLSDGLKRHHVQPGAGHYGVFSGSRWRKHVYPVLKRHIRSSD